MAEHALPLVAILAHWGLMRRLSLLLCCFLAACTVPAGPSTDPITNSGVQPDAALTKARDVRVIVYMHGSTRQHFIVVNAGHSWLADSKTRLAIALGKRTQGFKVLPEATIDRLLESLNGKSFEKESSPFVAGDESVLLGQGSLPERFRGTLYVEIDGQRSKVIGTTPSDRTDELGQERLRRFTELRMTAITFWDMKGQTDYPNPSSANGQP
ncbi:MAG: hypothetical protein EXS14_00530 [Planctomycetes bacterium]|nr:hypothetical protein [Planctomycetota bacterium]